jgi:hypothetical protein
MRQEREEICQERRAQQQ